MARVNPSKLIFQIYPSLETDIQEERNTLLQNFHGRNSCAQYGMLRDYRFRDAAEDIRGCKLYGLNDEKLGKIDDVIFDYSTGVIATSWSIPVVANDAEIPCSGGPAAGLG